MGKERNRLLNEEVEKEAILEAMCNQCGLCCHTKVALSTGEMIIHPTDTCEFLTEDNKCSVYEKRFEVCEGCLNREQMIERDFVLPDSCPYSRIRPDYKTARVVTIDEFNNICAIEALFQALQI